MTSGRTLFAAVVSLAAVALWSGYGLIVWGGELLVRTPPGTVGASDFWPSVDGAIFTPASS
jgi:hypothetical protein